VHVTIRCADAVSAALVAAHYRRMPAAQDAATLRYVVVPSNQHWLLTRDADQPFAASDRGQLLLALDQDLIVQLQRRRQDLYFLHAAALESAGKGFLLVAPSGGGKSTTTWALSHHGVRYLSDELAPLDLAALRIHPYPRALLLKGLPPDSYPLPPSSISTSRGFLLATEALTSGIGCRPAPLRGIFFVRYAPDSPAPSVRAISPAEASARLYANALNALAHPGEGLDAAVRVADQTACFELATGDLTKTCAVVNATLDRIA
jgi:hypothetical protein